MQTRLISTLSMPEMSDLISKTFVITGQMEELGVAEKFYQRVPVPSGSGDSRRFDEIDFSTFGRNMPQGADAAKADVAVGYNKTMYLKRRAIEIDITYIARLTGKDSSIEAKITSLSHYNPNRKELDLTHALTFATSLTYTDMDGDTIDNTGGDSLALAYTLHTLKYSGTTWSNRLTGDPVVSTGAIEAAELLAATNVLDNFGASRNLNFNTIFCGKDPGTKRNIKKIIMSSADVDGDNPGIKNTYTDYNLVSLPFLATDANGAYDSTKRRWWGIAALGELNAMFGVWEENNLKMPSAGNNGEDVHNDNWTYGSRMTYGKCWVTAKGLIMSCPTS